MIGKRIKELRKAKGVTQEQLAQIIGVERSSIGKYEGKQQVVPSDDVKIKLANYFGVSLDYLCCTSNKMHEEQQAAPASEDGLIAEIKSLMDSLPEEQRQQALSYIRFLASGAGNR